MGIFDRFSKKPEPVTKEPTAPRKAKTPKELATEKREPWVAVLDTSINPRDPRNGFFELDWNEFFIDQLRFAGYKGETDEELIDRWFRDLCLSVAAEDKELLDTIATQSVQSTRRRKKKSVDDSDEVL
jgi:hypothetical protein